MKNFFHTILLTTLLLTSCGNTSNDNSDDGNSTESETPRYVTYKASDFTIDVPDSWETVNDFTGEYPSGLRVAFKNNIKEASFTANVNIIREENAEKLTSGDATQKKLQNHDEYLLNYELLSQEALTLTVGGTESNTLLTSFSGKSTSDGPILNFMQVTLSKGDRMWTVTAAYREGEDEFTIEKMETMLKSFAVQ